ncbi:hypothetical protein DVH05_007501 [Phytophthora capsici]|nr:hypothetical protein DVH05_007501 [Phytophthora capsici]
MTLLQPTPEVFELFDSVLLLNDGKVLYNGPRNQVLPYFQNLGLVCPLDVDIADFLLDIATNQQQQYEMVQSGSIKSRRLPRLGEEFAHRFRQSSIFRDTVTMLEIPPKMEMFGDAVQHLLKTSQYRQSFWTSTSTLISRQLTITLRNKSFLCARALMVVGGGLIYGTTFFNVDLTNVQVTLGIVYQTAIFLSVGQVSEMTTFMATREIFDKQRRARFYRTLSFVVAYLTAATPVIVSECLVFGSLVYWMCGFVAEVGPFLVFLLGMILLTIALSGSFVVLSALSSSLDVAQPLASLATVFVSVFAGFVVPLAQIPTAFSWMYWVNPVSWCLRSVLVSQYRSSIFQVCNYDGENYCERFNSTISEYLLSQYTVPAREEWVWGGLAFLLLVIFFFVALGSYILEHKRFDHPVAMDPIKKDTPKPKCIRKKDDIKLKLQLEQQYSDYYFKIASDSSDDPPNTSVDVHDRSQFEPVTLSMIDLCYSVKTKHGSIDVLKGISGYALPGTMTALMGSSGAGKTTLLDVIAGRKTGGVIRGEIRLNGRPATERAVKYYTGYCEQQDIHSDTSTIREALTFSAFLRQDSRISAETKCASVEECLKLLNLSSIADKLIKGRSQEQIKRVTIGVELAALPSVLFMDEPTSGLDAHSAKIVMDGVRKVANSGLTVVCTIHQPSPDVFFLFDNLLLLKNGGQMVFFGELVNASPDQRECGHLIDYFQAIPGVPRLPEGQNPATWVLESIGAGIESSRNEQGRGTIDFVHRFRHSHEYEALLDKLKFTQPTHICLLDKTLTTNRTATSWTQFCLLTGRFFTIYWRTPSYNVTRLVISPGLGFIFGLLLFRGDSTTYQGINTAVGVILMTTLCQGNIVFGCILPFAARERASFYRERNAHTYNVLWYFVGSTLVEIPYALTSGLLFSAIFYPLLGFTSIGTALLYWINVSLFLLVEIYLGEFLVYALPTLDLATIVGSLFNSFFLLFSGFNPPAASIPVMYRWCYYISPHRYSLSVLVALLYSDCPQQQASTIGCEILENTPLSIGRVSVKEYIAQVYNIKHDDIWTYFGCIICYIVLLRVLLLLVLRYLNHQKR